MIRKIFLSFLLTCSLMSSSMAAYILVPMDDSQKNHLKAYGVAYWILTNNLEVEWLLNYRGGSFLFKHLPALEKECTIRGVSYSVIADGQAVNILEEISRPEVNMDVVKLEKAPKMAVYSPKDKLPWDDAVTLVLTYAEIPYDIIYDEEVITGKLPLYDWLHLHHEDFTGQYGKFYAMYHTAAWYQEQVRTDETMARKLGFEKVSQMKGAVARRIKEFTAGGGFMFSMCSGTDSYDISLAVEGIDICEKMYDGDGTTSNYNSKLDFSKTVAFRDFKLSVNPMEYEFSDIDMTTQRKIPKNEDVFVLFEFSAKWDPVPSMLCQNHTQVVKGFMGQTTSFKKDLIKPEVLVMGENKAANEARYIHGETGKGTWTFYGGHDPEDYQHMVGDPPTDLNLHPNSPGYRLILNNVLFPAAKKKKQKT
ncbi:MAG: asparagine synthetase B [Bacteroidetes bacterium]|nr:asparagine synthetase B [Bacteroidota bacterium]